MYFLKKTKSFERSYKRLKKSGIKSSVFKDLGFIVDLLLFGRKLPELYKDHYLNGELSQYRECHLKGDLLLIYKIEKENLILILVDIGSYSQLF